MKYDQIKELLEEPFRRLTGVKKTTFKKMFKGCKKFTVQDITLQPYNTVYELERWSLPDGTYIAGRLPKDIQGHYGPQLISYILHQYYGCRVTEALRTSNQFDAS